MASNNEGYLSHSWGLLTRDEGWIKPLLVLAAAQLVPVIGPIGVNGYVLEWARLTAWGVDSSPKQKGVDIGGCIKSGARALAVSLGFGLALGFFNAILNVIPLIGTLAALAVGLLTGPVIAMATLRATIYQQIGAGYQLDRLYDMVKRDSNGFLRVTGIFALLAAALAAVVSLFVGGILLSKMGDIIDLAMYLENTAYPNDAYVVSMMFGIIGTSLPLMFVVGYIISIAGTCVSMLTTNATALWMRQFDVQNWGESADPLPGTAGPAASRATAADPQYSAPSYAAPAGEQAPADVAQEPQTAAPTSAPATSNDGFADFLGGTAVASTDLSGAASNTTLGVTDKDEDVDITRARQAADSFSNGGDFGFVAPPTFNDEPAPSAPAAEEPVEEVSTFSLTPNPEPVAEEVTEREVESFALTPEEVTDVPVADKPAQDAAPAAEEDEPFVEDEVLAKTTAAIMDADVAAREEQPAPVEVENETETDEVMTFSLGGPSNETDDERVTKIKNYVDSIDGTDEGESEAPHEEA